MRVTEEAQGFFGIALDDNDSRHLLAMSGQYVCAHFFSDFVNLGKFQNLVDHAHDVNDSARSIDYDSMRQFSLHRLWPALAPKKRASPLGEVARRRVVDLLEKL
jgi:hypothetical protein